MLLRKAINFARLNVHTRYVHKGRKCCFNRSKDGFTLIELLLVVAILGILAVFSAPHFGSMLAGGHLAVGAREIASAGRYARTLALMNQRPVDLVIYQSTGTFSVQAVLTESEAGFADTGSLTGGQRHGSLAGGFGLAISKNDRDAIDTPDRSGSSVNLELDADIYENDRASLESMDVHKKLEGVKLKFKEYRDTPKSRGSAIFKMYKSPDVSEDSVVVIRYRANGTVRPYTLHVVDESDEKDYISVEVDSIGTPSVSKKE